MYKRIFFFIFLLFIVFLAIAYTVILKNNVNSNPEGHHVIFIHSDDSFLDVQNLLIEKQVLKNLNTFNWVAKKMNYPNKIKSGKYIINDNQNNKDLVSQLRSGKQSPVKLTLSNINSLEDIAQKAGNALEADSNEILTNLKSNDYLSNLGLDTLTIKSHLLPNTYEFYWNTNADKFIKRMISESNIFWNEERKLKAQKINLSPHQVVTLASIVQMESNKKDEYQRIAGVYLNRLKDNWPLQADPTVKYAMGTPELKRVLTIHTQFDSPYNTYKNTGLPPAPIVFPESYTIDAVLNAENHNYYFFCAREDFSGYHSFAKNLSEHNKNAATYQAALNKRGIF